MAACRRQPRFKAVQAGSGQQAVEAVAVPSVPSALLVAASAQRALLGSRAPQLRLQPGPQWCGGRGPGSVPCVFRGFEAGDSSDQLFPVRLAAGQRD